MAMQFEKAIEGASTLFLFDRRSQRQLREMADEALPRSRDRYLIRLSQAAFAYYNSAEVENIDMRGIIRQALSILREVKQYREDRSFYTLALRLEVDLLMHLSSLNFQDASPRERANTLYNEEDVRALSICETLLKNLPTIFEPLPSTWYSGLVPLFPPYREELLQFYKDRVQENRIVALGLILRRVRDELIIAAGVIKAKKFFSDNRVSRVPVALANKFLATNMAAVTHFVETSVPQMVQLASDVALPRGIAPALLETAVQNVERQVEQTRQDKDLRRYTGFLLQLGILQFLRENPQDTVGALVRTLRASARINPEDKKIRQYRHEEFPDIPFMIGTSYLRLVLGDEQPPGEADGLLGNAMSGLLRALALQRMYHQAYVNVLVAQHGKNDPAEQEALIGLYLSHFERDLVQLNGLAFRNLAYLDHQASDERLTPEVVKWLILSQFALGGEQTKAKKLLQELKTLYILNAHDFSIAYLDTYRTAFRIKDEEFIKDLEDSSLHSAVLFYMSHAFTSLSLTQGKNDGELAIDYANLDQGIELNAEALYFHPGNGSALRLVETQGQILLFALQRTQKRWENINNTMGQRFNFYEEYLRQEKSFQTLRDHLVNMKMEDKVPDFRLNQGILNRMNEIVTPEQRDRLRQRVTAT